MGVTLIGVGGETKYLRTDGSALKQFASPAP